MNDGGLSVTAQRMSGDWFRGDLVPYVQPNRRGPCVS